MSQLAKVVDKLSRLSLSNTKVVVTSVRHNWNKDYKPGPYPKTQAERLAAASRYGIHPEEYVPYNDDGTGYGDYPKIKAESGDSRDPNYPWDMPELKRNFGETLHVDFDLFREDRYDVNAKYSPSCKVQYLQFIGVMSGAFLIMWLCDYVKFFIPVVPKQYPVDGEKHYTFEQE